MEVFMTVLRRLPESMPVDNPQRSLQIAFVAVFYLVHLSRWELVEPFILVGGMASLVGLFVDPNAYVRSQAVDAFLQITSHPGFDWFKPPSSPLHYRLHRALLSLSDVGLLSACLKNQREASFPGCSYYCLQVQ